MVRMKYLIWPILIALALTLASATGGSSQQQESTQLQSEAQQSPAPGTVNAVAAMPSQSTTEASEPATRPQSWNDWFWQNSATLVLAILALWVGCIALNTLYAIRQQARIATEALTELEKPCVSIATAEPHVKEPTGHPLERPWFSYNFRNDGRSVAELTSVVGLVRLHSKEMPMPPHPSYEGALVDKSVFFIGPNSTTGKMRWTAALPHALIVDEYPAIHEGKTQLIFFGYVRYLDVFGNGHVSGFGWRYHPENDGMTLVGGNAYNYSRPYDEEEE